MLYFTEVFHPQKKIIPSFTERTLDVYNNNSNDNVLTFTLDHFFILRTIVHHF